MDASDIVEAGLILIRDWSLPLLAAFASVGVISMALIQAVKDIVPIRRWFHGKALDGWLTDHDGLGEKHRLIQLAAGGDAAALCELPTSGLMGQLTMASRVVLLFPAEYTKLLLTLAGSASAGDVQLIVDSANDEARRGTPPPQAPEDVARAQAEKDATERARVRVGHMIERNIDALQISVTSRWERYNKATAFGVSAVVTLAAFLIYFSATGQTASSAGPVLGLGLLVSVLAGFIAPVAKDLVSALQSLGKS